MPNEFPIELYPASQAPVIHAGDGQRVIDVMKWGVLGDGLAKKGIGTTVRTFEKWRWLVTNPAKRCLIPLTEFCQQTEEPYDLPDGKPATKGQIGCEVTNQPIFVVAGFWQRLGEDDHFAMVACNPNTLVDPIQPKATITILHPDDHDRWLTGSYDDVVALQRYSPSR